MEAKELRIGNYVEGIGMEHPIRKIYDSIQYNYKTEKYELDDIDIQYFKPIPLTEDILLKCGFKFKSYGYGDTEWKQWSFNGYSLNSFTCNTSGVDVKYLHQLQNLYFALTGEELKLKT